MTATKPTAAAMRAAAKLTTPASGQIPHYARIIDHEFAELVEAARAALNWLTSYPGGGANSAYDRLRAALARYEETK